MTVPAALRVALWRAAITALVILGCFVIPGALDAWDWILAQDDPAALTELGLKAALTPARLKFELEQALDADDVDLAESLITLGDQRRLPVPPDLRARYASAATPLEQLKRDVRDSAKGLVEGTAASGAGFVGVVARDLSGVGDVADLWREKEKISRGEQPDRVAMGLAAVGLVTTGATFVSLGEALPLRAGVSVFREATKAGRLSKPLLAQVERLAREAIDAEKLTAALTALGRFDVEILRAAARDAVSLDKAAQLEILAKDATTIVRQAGLRGAEEALAVARDSSEVHKAARLAATRGGSARAVLKLLGRGAFVLTTTGLILFGWTLAGFIYAWLAAAVIGALACRVARAAAWLLARLFSSLAGLHSVCAGS
ncbi:MAG TPA: hypothetical protein VEH76_02880 [Methylocystis sp.]|nr:hypothetical protein [Methylocystis sp.]